MELHEQCERSLVACPRPSTPPSLKNKQNNVVYRKAVRGPYVSPANYSNTSSIIYEVHDNAMHTNCTGKRRAIHIPQENVALAHLQYKPTGIILRSPFAIIWLRAAVAAKQNVQASEPDFSSSSLHQQQKGELGCTRSERFGPLRD